jgi:predicted PurR-regulated permease PerM
MTPIGVLHLALLLVLALLLWIMERALGPLVVLVSAWILVWPLRKDAGYRPIRTVLLLMIVFWIVHEGRWIVYPLITGTLAAYVLAPLVLDLSRRGLKRPLAAILALLPAGLAAVLVLLLLIPAVIEQTSFVLQKLPSAYALIAERFGPWLSRVGAHSPGFPAQGIGIAPADSTAAAMPAAPQGFPPWLQQVVSHGEALLAAVAGGLTGLGRGLGRFFRWTMVVLLTPVVAYYLLVDWDRLGSGVLAWMPLQWHGPARRLSRDLQISLRVYVRGQLLLAGVEAVLYSIAFLLAGVSRPFTLGILAGMLSLVPILGFWLTAILVVLSTLTGPEPWSTLLKGAVGLFGINLLEGQLLVPRIQGSGLKLHPLAVLLGVLLFGTILGVPGILLAVPIMGVIRTGLADIQAAWTRSGSFGSNSRTEGD